MLPDKIRFGSYTLYDDPPLVEQDDDGEGPRAIHLSRARFAADLAHIVDAAELLIEGRLDYETALRGHVARLADHFGDRAERIFSIDGIHQAYVTARS